MAQRPVGDGRVRRGLAARWSGLHTFATPDKLTTAAPRRPAGSCSSERAEDDFRRTARGTPEIAAAGSGAIRCAALPQLRGVVALGRDWDTLRAAGFDVSDALLDAISAEIHPSDEALVIYTSGTTARPKGVVHRQRTPVIQGWRFAELMGFGPEDRVYTAYPFFWTAGIAMALGATLAAGATLVLHEIFEPGKRSLSPRASAATSLRCGRTRPRRWRAPDAARADLASVRKIEFSSPLAKDRRPREGRVGHLRVTACPRLHARDGAAGGRARRSAKGTNGPALARHEVRIVDLPHGRGASARREGEIAVKGTHLDCPATRRSEPELFLDADGFFHTQDGGHLDAAGELHWRAPPLEPDQDRRPPTCRARDRGAGGALRGVRSAHAGGRAAPDARRGDRAVVVPTDGAGTST